MARRRYKSYKKRNTRSRSRGRGGKKTNLRWIIILLLVIAGGIIVIKKLPNDSKQDVTQKSYEDMLNDIVGQKFGKGGGEEETTSDSVLPDDTEPPTQYEDVLPPVADGITSDETTALIEKVGVDIKAGKIIVARDMLNKILHDMPLSNKDRGEVKSWLTKLSGEWLFSDRVFEDDTLTGTYKVVRGDVPAIFCKKFKVPHQVLLDINGIKDAGKVQLGNMKVANGPFRVVVQLSKFNMDLYLQDQYVKSYQVGIGKPDRATPTGQWRVRKGDKLEKPTWYDQEGGKSYVSDDPDNPLGARWIGIEGVSGDAVGQKGYALHGTKEPASIGTKCSRGCIRMHDKDVIEVYGMLTPVLSHVTIME